MAFSSLVMQAGTAFTYSRVCWRLGVQGGERDPSGTCYGALDVSGYKAKTLNRLVAAMAVGMSGYQGRTGTRLVPAVAVDVSGYKVNTRKRLVPTVEALLFVDASLIWVWLSGLGHLRNLGLFWVLMLRFSLSLLPPSLASPFQHHLFPGVAKARCQTINIFHTIFALYPHPAAKDQIPFSIIYLQCIEISA